MPNPVLQVENLVKRYGDVEAVRGVSFQVEEGEVFGLLGPNGAGKTSTIEVLEGLRLRDGGNVSVCGFDPQKNPDDLKHEIGAALQSTSLPDKIRVSEALGLFASFYRRRRKPDELLKRFGLEEKRNAFYSTLSGGQKQRLALAMALVNDPKVLFLDEPTAGLDPQVRREIYDIIEELKREKKTIVLTTHYIEEAERLCDRVAIIDHGKVIVEGTPRSLRPVVRDEIYRIGGEALANVFRHANASAVETVLEYAGDHFRLLVRDDGQGIDPEVLSAGREGHFGLSGMRERAQRIGAQLKIRTAAGAGTEIDLIVPSSAAFERPDPHGPVYWIARLYSRVKRP